VSFDTPSKIYNGYSPVRQDSEEASDSFGAKAVGYHFSRNKEVICIEDKEIFSGFYFVGVYSNDFGWFLSFFIGR